MDAVRVGDPAPDFALDTADGRTVRLADYRGRKNVVLFFYPKDDTTGCTIEACTFRDSYQDFVEAGAEVIGISADDASSHTRFANRHRLQMLLLSDPTGQVHAQYGARRALGIFPDRVTFLIDKEGVVRHIVRGRLTFKRHAHESLERLRTLPR
jgi:peroxiredoxin Q/BCP